MMQAFLMMVALSYATADTAPTYIPADHYGPPTEVPLPLPYAPAYQEPEPVHAIQPASVPYLHQYNAGPEGFNVQSGYEGFLVPAAQGKLSFLPLVGSLGAIGTVGKGLGLLKHFSPFAKFGLLKLMPKIVTIVGGLLLLFAVGGLFTTAICTFTPFCTIRFLGFSFTPESMRGYLTQDRISQAATFVKDAIHKYQALYEKDSEQGVIKSNEVDS